jgi:hypothetical protein
MGAKDVTTLIDAKADRAGILREIDGLIRRTRPNDLIVLSIAGHGTQEPERVKGSEPDGMENVFLLAGFEPSPTGSQQRVLGKEFNHFIKQLELKGARVMFVADTCHGGGMAREVDPRGGEMSFRQVPSYRLTNDTLKPVTTTSEAFTTELDFDRTDFLAAVDRKTKSPEVSIPGVAGLWNDLTDNQRAFAARLRGACPGHPGARSPSTSCPACCCKEATSAGPTGPWPTASRPA